MGSKPSAFPEDGDYHSLQIVCKEREIFFQKFSHILPTSTAGLWIWTTGKERLKRLKRSRGLRGSTESPQRVKKKGQVTKHRMEVCSPGYAVRAWKWVGTRSVSLREECFWGRIRYGDMAVKGRRKWEGKIQEPAETKRSKICQCSFYPSHRTPPPPTIKGNT